MGLYDRDYYRNDPAGRGTIGGVAPVCAWLIAINVGVFILQLLTNSPELTPAGELTGRSKSVVTEWLELSPNLAVGHYQVWRLLTYAFCHAMGSPFHIICNMMFLWICGRQVEPIYGPAEFLRFYLAAAVLSGLCFTAFAFAIGRGNAAIGASGAVMGVAMLCALYYPTMELRLMLVIPVQMRWLVAAYVVFDLFPVLQALGGRGVGDGVAHAAHLGGLAYGFLYKHFDLRFSRLFSDWRWPRLKSMVRGVARRNPNVKLYHPPEERRNQADLERQVDEILAKITAQGESSLTDAERAVLKEASQRYKRR